MTKKQRTITCIIIGAIVIIALSLITINISMNFNPIKSTKWMDIEHGSVLTLKDSGQPEGYQWTNETNSVTGSYNIYKGRKAKKFLDEYAEKHINGMDSSIPEEEKDGLLDTIEEHKKNLSDKVFVVEECLEKAVINGTETKPQNNVYIATLEEDDNLSFVTVVGNEQVYFKSYDENNLIKPSKYPEGNFEVDQKCPIDTPHGYKLFVSEKEYAVMIAENLIDDITISVMEDTPLSGISDEFISGESYKGGFKATIQIGPNIKHVYLFQKDKDLYYIVATQEEALEEVISSLRG